MDMPVRVTGTLAEQYGECRGAATINDGEPYWQPIAGAFTLETVANPGTNVRVRIECNSTVILDQRYRPANHISVGAFINIQNGRT